jgi:hypothetical protein
VQRFIAEDWPIRLWMGIVPVAVPAAVCWYLAPLPWLVSHWLNLVVFTGVLLLAWGVGWFAAIIPGWLLLGPLYYTQEWRNGAPYRVGDYVRVLVRRHRGRVVRVYDLWAERHQVRVELGDEERERVTDVFSYVEVCREPNPRSRPNRRCGRWCAHRWPE